MVRRISLKPRTPFSSLFTADQMWGQFIWAISDILGEEKATETVKLYAEGVAPVFFSSAMLNGYLPKPQYVDALADFSNKKGKNNKKCKWLTYEAFSGLQGDSSFLKKEELSLNENMALENVEELHVAIPRNALQESSNLFNASYKYSKIPLVVYVDIKSEGWNDILCSVIDYWRTVGLGGDRNVGRGQFDIDLQELSEKERDIFSFRSESGFVSLSESFGPDLSPLYYSVDVYAGFVGRKNEMNGIYRKKPVIRYLTGSFFKSGSGCIVKTIDSQDIYSYGYTFPVYMKLEEHDGV